MKPTLWQRIKRHLAGQQIRSAYAGAVDSRLNDFVFGQIQIAKQETRHDVRVLRGRARELARNNPSARRFLKLLEQNVVGHCGIRLESQVLLKTGPNAGTPDDKTNDAIETAWKGWGKVGQCDVTRKYSWTGLSKQALRATARDGEAFVRLVDGFPNDYGFAVQLIDADQVDDSYYGQAPGSGNLIEQGVEFDKWGAPVGFWVWTAHPNDPTSRDRRRERIPAEDVIHLYLVEREGQVRGVTWFAPVTLAMRHLDGYTEAELVAARTAAAKMGWIKNTEDAPGPDPEALPGTKATMQAEPGSIEQLGPGQEFQSWDPTHPAGNFEPFVLAIQRLMAMGLNVSHMSLTGDLRQANYSSARVGLLDERDGWRDLQTWLIEHLCDRVYRRWVRMASLSPKLTLSSYDLTRYQDAVTWRPRGWPWVDPKNDIETASIAVDRGFKSEVDIAAENGDELEDVYIGLQKARRLREKYGIPEPVPIKPTLAQPGENVSGTQDAASATTDTTNGNGRGHGKLVLRPLTNGRTA